MTTTAQKSIQIARLRHVTRYFYDLQKLRIQSGNRDKSLTVELSDKDKEFLGQTSEMLEGIEKHALKEINRLLKPIPVSAWLTEQRGIGPTMAGVLLSYVNIENCHTVSKLWAWCGLAVIDGHADRRKKGEKARFDPWLKSKVLAVMGGNLIKACSYDEQGYYIKVKGERREIERPWRKFYDDYKHRKENTPVAVCMGCEGSGIYKISPKERDRLDTLSKLDERGQLSEEEIKELAELLKVVGGRTCGNCNGTGGPAPWGRSQQHRHNAALRYMVKMFLAEFWEQWRRAEGLPVRPSYAEEYLGKRHDDPQFHAGT